MFLWLLNRFDGYFRLFQGTNQIENEHIGAFNLFEYKSLINFLEGKAPFLLEGK